MLMTTGGDERIWLDPVTRRNRYGVGASPAPDELWFSSSTASASSQEGYDAALSALRRLTAFEAGQATLPALFDDIRRRLLALYGAPGSAAVLVPSGTEAELLTLALARTLMPGPLTNIVVAPKETGSGVLMAAGGANFQDSSSLGETVHKGDRLRGLERADIAVATIAIRHPNGAPRPQQEIDAEAGAVAAAAIAAGRGVILHVLDTSKTGLAGLSRSTAAAIAEAAPGRVFVAVDACQLRCSADQLREDQAQGFVALITGSKFAGGPPFSGALLLPEAIADQLSRRMVELPGLGSFSALHDWPDALRPAVEASVSETANLGLALRWVAALDVMEKYEAIDSDLRDAIADRFHLEVNGRITRCRRIARLDDHDRFSACRTIVPFVVLRPDAPAGLAETVRVREALRDDDAGPRIHLGQAVSLGERNVLRICASMQHVVEIAGQYARTGNFIEAFDRHLGELDLLFGRLELVLAEQLIPS
jgi:hypothetical protein